MLYLLVDAKEVVKTAVWNDLRNHVKEKEIHLKAEWWMPVRDFSYTSQGRQILHSLSKCIFQI